MAKDKIREKEKEEFQTKLVELAQLCSSMQLLAFGAVLKADKVSGETMRNVNNHVDEFTKFANGLRTRLIEIGNL
ncbi:MAG: hypothetical protein HY432_02960 [Candidatus Liptonbacteria bacterium]|nr:hypothetical protein [Candidatus Liptonbacteria bacterium]